MNQMRREGEYIVAVCDFELLGKYFEEGDRCIHVSESFYKGKLVPVEESIAALQEATIANLVGECIVQEALKAELIHERGIIRIQNVPHAQVVVTK
jgi:hypothetical protein